MTREIDVVYVAVRFEAFREGPHQGAAATPAVEQQNRLAGLQAGDFGVKFISGEPHQVFGGTTSRVDIGC